MKKCLVILCVSLTLLSSCSKVVLKEQPLKYSFMPKYLDVDSIGATIPAKQDVVDSTLDDFKSIPLDEGILITDFDTIDIPAGILISDKKAAEYLFYKSGYERQEVIIEYSRYLSKEYYEKSLETEKLYQEEIIELKDRAERSWLEKNSGYLGFLSGTLTAILSGILIVNLTN